MYLPPEPDLLWDCPPPDIQDGNASSAQFQKDFKKIKLKTVKLYSTCKHKQ
jgi:hypothetical protein